VLVAGVLTSVPARGRGAAPPPPRRKLAAVPAPRPLPAAPPRTGSHRRRPAGAALAAALALALAGGGCASFDRTFGQQEAVVQFRPRTPESVRLKVRAACSHVPQATPEPLPTDHLASDLVNNVRDRVDNASDGNLAKLQRCLQKFPSVVGIEFTGPGGS